MCLADKCTTNRILCSFYFTHFRPCLEQAGPRCGAVEDVTYSQQGDQNFTSILEARIRRPLTQCCVSQPCPSSSLFLAGNDIVKCVVARPDTRRNCIRGRESAGFLGCLVRICGRRVPIEHNNAGEGVRYSTDNFLKMSRGKVARVIRSGPSFASDFVVDLFDGVDFRSTGSAAYDLIAGDCAGPRNLNGYHGDTIHVAKGSS